MAVRRSFGILAALLCAASTAPWAAPAVPPPPAVAATAGPVPGTDPDRFARMVVDLEAAADRIASSGHVVGMALAVVHRGEVVSARGYGVADAGTRAPVGDRTVFRLASLSKGLAASCIALLVRDGYLGWDDPVQPLVPAFELSDRFAAPRVTVRDLLSHRVGLPYNALDRVLEKDEPYPLLVYRLRELPLTCSPGDCYAYQNIAFSLSGDIAFATTGRFYTYEVERRLFHPLGMVDATFGRDALEANPDHANPHVRGPRSFVPVRPKETYYRVMPAAGANASIRDMAQWLLAQLGHHPDVLPTEVLEELHAPEVDTPGEIRSIPWRRERVREAQYALGFRVYDYQGHRMVFHGGAVQGFRGMLALLPEHDLGVVLLWNNESAVPSGLLPDFLDRYLGLPAADWVGFDRLAKAAPRPARTTTRRH
jgi:beta-lactamase class C